MDPSMRLGCDRPGCLCSHTWPPDRAIWSACLLTAVHGAAVTDIDNDDACLVVLHAIDDPPAADAHPEQSATAYQGFDLGRRRIVGEIAQSHTNAVADHSVQGCVLLAGTPGQFDLISGGHLLSALRELGVHVGKPVGALVVGFPLG